MFLNWKVLHRAPLKRVEQIKSILQILKFIISLQTLRPYVSRGITNVYENAESVKHILTQPSKFSRATRLYSFIHTNTSVWQILASIFLSDFLNFQKNISVLSSIDFKPSPHFYTESNLRQIQLSSQSWGMIISHFSSQLKVQIITFPLKYRTGCLQHQS